MALAVGGAIAVTALAGGAGARALSSSIAASVLPNTNAGNISGAGLNCGNGGSTCFSSVADGMYTLTAAAATGWAFDKWDNFSDECPGSTSSTCAITVNSQTVTVLADFDPKVTVTVTGNGTVTGTGGISCTSAGGANCSKPFHNGDSVTLTATPATGATFTGWTGCPTTPSGTTCSFVMDSQPVNVQAAFSGGTTNTLTVSVTGNGTVTGTGGINCTSAGGAGCSQSYAPGTAVTLTETPGSGATFTGWSGSCSGTSSTCNLTMDASKTVGAAFSGGTFPLTVTVTGSGNVTGGGINCGTHGTTCSQSEPAGTNVTLAEVPDSGATFTGWTGACSGTGSTCTLTMNAAKTVGATFTTVSSNKATLTLTVRGRGTISAPDGSCSSTGGTAVCTQQYATGTSVTLSETPDSGASFSGWSGSCTGTAPTCTVQMTTSKSATADFTGGTSAGGFTARSLGAPLSAQRGNSCAFTIRFSTNESASAQLRILRGGNAVETLVFSAIRGNQRFGPIGLSRGTYALLLKLTSSSGNVRSLRWNVACGSFVPPPQVGFQLSQGTANVSRISSGWLVNLRFRTNRAASMRMRVIVGGRVVSDFGFTPRAGIVQIGPFFFTRSGVYEFTLRGADFSGRVRALRWFVELR